VGRDLWGHLLLLLAPEAVRSERSAADRRPPPRAVRALFLRPQTFDADQRPIIVRAAGSERARSPSAALRRWFATVHNKRPLRVGLPAPTLEAALAHLAPCKPRGISHLVGRKAVAKHRLTVSLVLPNCHQSHSSATSLAHFSFLSLFLSLFAFHLHLCAKIIQRQRTKCRSAKRHSLRTCSTPLLFHPALLSHQINALSKFPFTFIGLS